VSVDALAPTRHDLCEAFAGVLDYPHVSPAPAARACAASARSRSEEAAELVESFAALVETSSLGVLQEEFTRAFDLDTMSRTEPTCYPYVGHYLFDESHKRGAFILGLKKRFRTAGFEDESDLADHLVVLLRFLVVCEDDELADEIVDDAILPALERIGQLAAAGGPGSPQRQAYLDVLRALALTLGADRPMRETEPLTAEIEREWARNRDSLGIDRAWCGH
jgi:nitrate reductase assembly molybdenum cofactor insertion protein NarJ